jgi:hypothetical protein
MVNVIDLQHVLVQPFQVCGHHDLAADYAGQSPPARARIPHFQTRPAGPVSLATALGPLRSDGSAGDKLISPLPVALVEGRRRVQWCPPGTPDSVAARKAKAFHQVN